MKFTDTLTWHRKRSEVDIEQIAREVYESIARTVDNRWFEHQCSSVGCREGFVVIDGNERLFRLICNATKKKTAPSNGEPAKYDQLCIRDPIRGNNHIDASQYCQFHAPSSKTLESEAMEAMDFRRITRSMAKHIPMTVTSGLGCKEDGRVDRFYTRSAGMLYMFRPCGIRLSHWEMYTSESLSQVFLCLLDLFGNDITNLRGIVYDRACDLHPFIEKLAREGNQFAKLIVHLLYLVDVFHVEGHTMPKCVLGNAACQYHPHLEKFNHVRGMNTEIAEQSFRYINPFKYITKRMTYGKRLVYLKLLDNFTNTKKEESNASAE